MPHPMSPLGAAHTLISLVPVVAGIYAIARYRTIDVARRSGQIYLAGLTLAVLTSFGLSSTGGFNVGHALGILALIAAFGSLLVSRLPLPTALKPYLSTFGLSFSLFLTLVPGINETLTRLPVAHPLASGPDSPIVKGALGVWLLIFVLACALQGWSIRSAGHPTAAAAR